MQHQWIDGIDVCYRIFQGSVCALFLFSLVSCATTSSFSAKASSEEAYQFCEKISKKKKHDEAIQCYELLKSRYPGTEKSAESHLQIGDHYFGKKEYLIAVEAYQNFIRLYPAHPRVEYAYYRVGLSYLKESPSQIDRDQQYLDESIHYLELVLQDKNHDFYPVAQEKWTEARSRLARREYYVGSFYFRTHEYLAAIPRFQEVLSVYEGLGFDEKSLYYLAESYRRLEQKSQAIDVLGILERHFPKSPYRRKLARKLGVAS